MAASTLTAAVSFLIDDPDAHQALARPERPDMVSHLTGLAKSKGVGVDAPDIEVALTILLQPADGELDDDALDGVAGGVVLQGLMKTLSSRWATMTPQEREAFMKRAEALAKQRQQSGFESVMPWNWF